ncbi:MAG: response regulator [Fibromonadaceae bacterium]|jgi:signal transduction histidine kinase/PleD family two-component response regulator/HPt (histidine-containing phosphotransfer) domain-containing protein|nr:response regulator [Fibromonadaceae bacterium]
MDKKKNSILIVDDENSNIIALTHILSAEYTIFAAKNGQAAISAAEKYLPDIILLDIIMPEMSGYEVINLLKKNNKTQNIPVIFISGLSDADNEKKGLALGAVDYIAKPFSATLVKLRVLNQIKLIEQFRLKEYDIMKYKLLNDALSIGLWDMDVIDGDPVNPQNKFTWSQEFRQMLGFTDENDFPNILQSWSDQLHPEDKERTLEAFAAHINDCTGKTSYDIEYRLMMKGGEIRYFQALGTTRRDSDGTPIKVAGALMDITEKRQMIEKVKAEAKKRAEVEMTSKAKSTFLANMSHEIRTPMNAILGITEIMRLNKSLPADIKEGLGKIHDSCGLLLGIINDILDFSKVEAGKLDIMPEEYETASLINDSVQLNIMKIENKPIEFELKIDEKLPAKLIGDQLRIKQVLNNLLSNAFKYTDAGKVTLTATCEAGEDGPVLALSVQDTGYGMSKKQVNKLFDEYSRFNNESGRTIEGTGLGLAITQRLIKLMNADIHVESEPGKGSLFTVQLPQGTVDSEVLGKDLVENLQQFRSHNIQGRKKAKITRDPMPYGSVLVVDDVETNLYVSEGLMKPYELQIDTVLSGFEAIDKIKNGKVYDIIFMDHMMPKMDGMETTKRLRDLGYTSPIVALTANAVVGQADIFLQNGFDDFISKPIDIYRLNSILNKLIRDKQPADVIETARKQMNKTETDSDQPQISSLLLASFNRDANKTVTVLEELLPKKVFGGEELRKIIISVHGIKSALRNIREIELSEAAYQLEQAGREQNIELMKSSAADFLKDLRALLERLKPENNDSTDEDLEGLRSKLLTIKNYCADYNRKEALILLEEIKKQCSKETRIILEKVSELVQHSEFDKAESKIASYVDNLSSVTPAPVASAPVAPAPIAPAPAPAPAVPAISVSAMEIPGLDISQGLDRYDGDEKVYLKILRSYAANVRSLLNSIEVVDEAELNRYEITVHGIKGASFDIFADQIGESASNLEKAAVRGDLSYINEHNQPFIETARKLIYYIDDMLAAIDAQNPKPKKDKPDDKALAKLLAACKVYDSDEVDAAMVEIEAYQYESDGGLAEWLKENVVLMNFSQIAEKLSNK